MSVRTVSMHTLVRARVPRFGRSSSFRLIRTMVISNTLVYFQVYQSTSVLIEPQRCGTTRQEERAACATWHVPLNFAGSADLRFEGGTSFLRTTIASILMTVQRSGKFSVSDCSLSACIPLVRRRRVRIGNGRPRRVVCSRGGRYKHGGTR